MSYKVASDKRQTALHRGRLADWVGAGEERRTPLEEWKDLKRQDQHVSARLAALPKNSPERRELGLRRQEISRRLQAMRPAVKAEHMAQRGIEGHFVDVARDLLAPGQFRAMWEAAKRKQAEAAEAAPP